MKNRYTMFLRNVKGHLVYYCENSLTGKQESLRTKKRHEAQRLLAVKNEAQQMPTINAQIARMYLLAGDSRFATRSWQTVIDTIISQKYGETRNRWERVKADEALSHIWIMPLITTKADDLHTALRKGKVATNAFLRRLHNFAVDMAWIPTPIIPKRQWPAIRFKTKRAITLTEHNEIIAREKNAERRAFYQLCWHFGGAQGDIARLEASNIDWNGRTVAFVRKKTGQVSRIRFGHDAETVLRALPEVGPLFPYMRTVRASDRATEFKQRCKGLEIFGVTLHSYRYTWAERSASAGYPERYAQQALGQSSKAVHRAYAKNADTTLPALEEFERELREKIVPMVQPENKPALQSAAG